MVVGAVVGIGIFKTPSVVAANVTSEVAFLGLWLLGGVVTLVGALCYAELGSTYPHFGGEYHFLRRAYGPGLGFLFAWGRMAVMQSGSIAAVAFVYGDYASFLFPVGASGSAVHAALAVISLSALQLMGTELSTRAQVALTIASVAVVLVVSVIGLAIASQPAPTPPAAINGSAGRAMVFILLTYGGWSEAAYISGEVRDARRDIPRALLIGTATVTALYLLANYSYLTAFGLEGLRQSNAVAADLVRVVFGAKAAVVVAGVVCVTSLSTLNATILHWGTLNFRAGPKLYSLRRSGQAWRRRSFPPQRYRCPVSRHDRAPCVRGIFPRRLRVDGRVHCAGVLDVHASGRDLAVRASLARPEKSDPIPSAALSGDASAFLRHGDVSPLFEPLTCRCRSAAECRDILGRHPDIPPWPARDRKK